MRRTLLRALAIGALSALVLTGCGHAAKDNTSSSVPPPSVTATTAAPTSTTDTSGDVDSQLNDVNNLLSQIDGQVSADAQTPTDSD